MVNMCQDMTQSVTILAQYKWNDGKCNQDFYSDNLTAESKNHGFHKLWDVVGEDGEKEGQKYPLSWVPTATLKAVITCLSVLCTTTWLLAHAAECK